MTYSKRIVCLANSRKPGGACVAGLEIEGDDLGGWIRPVSRRASRELTQEERCCHDGREVRLLDIVEIIFARHNPESCQVENHIIANGQRWRRIGRFRAEDLRDYAVTQDPLWVNGDSSYNGLNDRIPEADADRLNSSLRLVPPRDLVLYVGREFRKHHVRAKFKLGSTSHWLMVTDPRLESAYLAKQDGSYPLPGEAAICVSLSEPYKGHRYKLAASIIDLLQ